MVKLYNVAPALQVSGVRGAAEAIGVEAEDLEKTLTDYRKQAEAAAAAAAAGQGGSGASGDSSSSGSPGGVIPKRFFPFPPVDLSAPLYLAQVTPVVHYCMGGLATDEGGRVLEEGR